MALLPTFTQRLFRYGVVGTIVSAGVTVAACMTFPISVPLIASIVTAEATVFMLPWGMLKLFSSEKPQVLEAQPSSFSKCADKLSSIQDESDRPGCFVGIYPYAAFISDAKVADHPNSWFKEKISEDSVTVSWNDSYTQLMSLQ